MFNNLNTPTMKTQTKQNVSTTINRTWFKNRMRKGELLVKCSMKLTDDYAYDAASNFRKDPEFKECPKDYFDDWFLSKINIWGDKNGTIDVVFASCEYYDFKLKDNESN